MEDSPSHPRYRLDGWRFDPDALATRVLSGPLSLVVGILCLGHFLLWFPSYLTWPWWSDHDVFAVAAQSWDAGVRPYRDLKGNNFPGTTYVFWALGRTFGWGVTAPFWAFDGLLLAGLCLLILLWSRRRLGASLLPGLIGVILWLRYYLELDYSLAAQRDWQGPAFAVAGLLAAQIWPDRRGWVLAGLGLAAGLTFRPQVILLAPASALAVWSGACPERFKVDTAAVRALTLWAAVVLAGLALGFAPLILNGVMEDFLLGLRTVAPGASYNKFNALSALDSMVRQFKDFRILVVPLALVAVWQGAGAGLRRVAWPWMLALAGVALYRPLSPVTHAYLAHPLQLVWVILAAILAAFAIGDRRLAPSQKLALVLLVLGLNATLRPRFCNPGPSGQVLANPRTLLDAHEPFSTPPGYTTSPSNVVAAHYDWKDYRELLEYLRLDLPREVPVINALYSIPAVAGPSGHLTALPAESTAWLTIVNPTDEPQFTEALLQSERAVVVWSPSESAPFWVKADLSRFRDAIREHYEPSRRFGAIEVWRRKDGAGDREAAPIPDRRAK